MEENKEKKEEKQFNEDAFLKKVEKAASKGANMSTFKNAIISSLPAIIIIALVAAFIIPKINTLDQKFSSVFHLDEPVSEHDQTIENNGILGYTAADFEEAVLGDSSKLKKLEVYKQEISDVVTITDTGLLNWGIFTKNQLITYNGTVVYTVDLSTLRSSDIKFNEADKIITLTIPHAKQEDINIPEDKIMFGDTTNGLLAFGDIKLTPEQNRDIQAEARQKMQEKLDTSNVLDNADRFAILSVWEMYSPIIKGVAKDYSLEVVFR